jgi:hypothetical protein
MALAIFDARPDRVKAGDLFDSDLQYVYKSSGSTIKYPSTATIQTSGDRLTYSFDGFTYSINSAINFAATVEVLSVG